MQPEYENELRGKINNLEKQVEYLKQYKMFYENAPLPYQSLDEDGFIIDVNPAWLKLLNYHRKEVIGKPIVAFLHPEEQTYFYENFKEFKQCGYHHNVEFRIKHKAGYYLNVTLDGLVGYHPDGSFRQTYCLLKDITENKKLQEKLQKSEEKFKALYENAPLPYQSLDEQGNILDVNPAWLNALGYQKEEVLGKSFLTFLEPEHSQSYFQKYFPVLKKKGVVHDVQYGLIHKNGQYINVTFEGVTGYNPDGSFRQTYCVFKDITEQKKAKKALVESEKKFRNVFNTANDAIFLFKLTEEGFPGKFIEVNEKASEMLGYTKEELMKMSSLDIEDPKFRSGARQPIQELKKNNFITFETSQLAKNGTRIPVEISSRMFLLNKESYIVSIARNITDRKQAEDKIQDQADFLKKIIESLTHPFYVIDVNDYSIKLKNTAANLTQKSGAQTCYALTHNRDTPCGTDKHPCPLKEVLKTKKPAVVEHIHKDSKGNDRIVEVHAYPVFDKKGEVKQMIEYNLDITERKKLITKNLMLSRAVEQSPECIVITNKDGEIEYVNPMFKKITGYSHEEVVGRNPRILQSGKHNKTFYRHLWDTILSGNNWYGEFHNKRKDGTFYWERASISPIVDNNNNITHFVAVKEDITEKKRIVKELEEAKEKAEESDRLKSSFLANMSHEIRTPMNGIIGFSQLLKEKEFPRDRQIKFIDIIHSKTQGLLRIISDIVDISKIDVNQLPVHKSSVSLNDILHKLYETYKLEIEKNGKEALEIHVNMPLSHENSYILTDPQRLEQILENLLSNAVKFTEKGQIEFGYKKQQKDMLLFYVKDTGIGISPENYEQIFQRFRQIDGSSNRLYEGTGLGLAIIKNLVELLGGTIWVESEKGKGSVFYFTIPFETANQKPASTENYKREKDYNWKGKRILLVEDDPTSADYLKEIITSKGAELIVKETGEEGLFIFETESQIDLILMDIRLPGINGLEAIEKIREQDKKVPVIAQTAHAMGEDHKKCLEAGADDYIAKPIEIKNFMNILNKYL